MTRHNPARLDKIRITVRHLLAHDALRGGAQARLAEYFGLTRQRVHQIVVEERARIFGEEQTRAETAVNASPVRTG